MRPKKLHPKRLLKEVNYYMRRRGRLIKSYFKTSKRGRPPKYPDDIILLMLFLQVIWKLSFREAEDFAVNIFGRENIPDFSTYYYRLKHLPSLLLIDFLNFLSSKLLKKYHKRVVALIFDGTGFKYDELYPLKVLRGREIKQVKSHVKAVILSAHLGNGKRFIVSLSCGRSYSSEVKLAQEVLNFVFHSNTVYRYLKGKPVLGDKAYDSEEFINELLLLGLKPYIKVRESFRKRVVSSVRRWCKSLVERDSLYRKRGMVEGIFGEVKQALGSYERAKDFQIAQLFVIAKFCVFNLWVLALVIRIFQTASPCFKKQDFLSNISVIIYYSQVHHC